MASKRVSHIACQHLTTAVLRSQKSKTSFLMTDQYLPLSPSAFFRRDCHHLYHRNENASNGLLLKCPSAASSLLGTGSEKATHEDYMLNTTRSGIRLLSTRSNRSQPINASNRSLSSNTAAVEHHKLNLSTLDTKRAASSSASPGTPATSVTVTEKPEKGNVHILKANLDQGSVSSHHDDVSPLASRRVDPTTIRHVYYFDTLAFTKRLEAKGYSREQAEGFAECLVDIINTTLDHQGRHMVTKPQQEIAVQQLLSEIVSVKKDMTLLQKSEFSSLKTETEKISIELSQVRGHMNDEIVKLKGQFSLDINLERGRAIEAHAENEKKLQQLHNKIETEIANLKTIYEVYRNDVFKYAAGTVLAVGSLILGVLRLWQ